MPEIDIDELWDFEKPEASEARFQELLSESALDAALRCEVLTQIARAQGLQSKFPQAHATLAEAEELRCAEPRCSIRILLERGRAFNSDGAKHKARPLFIRAWEVAVETGEEALEVNAAHMIAIVEPPAKALEWNEKALQTAQRSEDPKARKWLGSLLNNLGWTYHEMGEYERSLELFVRALRFRAEQGKEPELGIARWCVARCLRSLGRLDEALSMQQLLSADYQKAGRSDGYVQEELGEILYAQGKADDAVPYFARAYELLRTDLFFAKNEPHRLDRLRVLGRL